MNHKTIRQKLVKELAERPGWQQHPEQDHHFRHAETDVHILIYTTELLVAFGALPGQRYDKAVGAKTTHFPSLAIAAVLEVADALVEVRRLTKQRAEDTATWEQAVVAGDEPSAGPG
jgi:hypothetical protein